MTNRKRSVLSWIVGLILGLALYALSFGPAYALLTNTQDPIWQQRMAQVIFIVYAPVTWSIEHSPAPVKAAANWYVELWVPEP